MTSNARDQPHEEGRRRGKAPKIHFDPNLTPLERQQLWFNSQLLRQQAPERIAYMEAQRRLQREKTVERWAKQESMGGASVGGEHAGLRTATHILNAKASKVVHLSDLIVIDEATGTMRVVKDQRGKEGGGRGGIPHESTKEELGPARKRSGKPRDKRPSAVKASVFAARERWLAQLEELIESLTPSTCLTTCVSPPSDSLRGSDTCAGKAVLPSPALPCSGKKAHVTPNVSKPIAGPSKKPSLELFGGGMGLMDSSDEDEESADADGGGSDEDVVLPESQQGANLVKAVPSQPGSFSDGASQGETTLFRDAAQVFEAGIVSGTDDGNGPWAPLRPSKSKVKILLDHIRSLEALYTAIGEAKVRAKAAREALEQQQKAVFPTPLRKSRTLVVSGDPIRPSLPTQPDPTTEAADLPHPTSAQCTSRSQKLPRYTREDKEVFHLLSKLRGQTRFLRERLLPAVMREERAVAEQGALARAVSSDAAQVSVMPSPKDADDTRLEIEHVHAGTVADEALAHARQTCNFFPPLNKYRVGHHPLIVDLRTPRRYPKMVEKSTITELLLAADIKANEDRYRRDRSHDGGAAEADHQSDTLFSLGFGQPKPQSQQHIAFSREYVTNVISDTLDDLAHTLVETLREAQQRLKEKHPMQFKARRRYVSGLREALAGISTGTIRCVLLAPDVERVSGEDDANIAALNAVIDGTSGDTSADESVALGNLRKTVRALGLEGSIRTIIAACRLKSIPVVYCLSRSRMAHSIRQRDIKVSCIGIFSVNGANDVYRALMGEAARCRRGYDVLVRKD